MRRLMTLIAAVLVAAAVVPAMASTAQAVEPTRSDSKNNPVIFVHGFLPTNCTDTWSVTGRFFRDKGWTGPLVTYGYYNGDDDCTWKYGGTLDTNINTLAKDLAKRIYNTYTRYNIKVDVVAYSMGGLIARSAVLHSGRTDGWPGRLIVEDVITLATPHRGTDDAGWCSGLRLQCRQMQPNSTFIRSLQVLGNGPDGHPRLPNGRTGTDWTVLASSSDGITSLGSGTGVSAEHKVQYVSSRCTGDEPGLVHDGFHRQKGIYCFRKQNNFGSWSGYSDSAAWSPVARSYHAVYRHAAA